MMIETKQDVFNAVMDRLEAYTVGISGYSKKSMDYCERYEKAPDTTEQEQCEYCHGGIWHRRNIFENPHDPNFGITPIETVYIAESAACIALEDSTVALKIKFCPMCGRKLGDDADD